MTPSTRIDGEALLLEAKCDACNRESGRFMCALCEAMTVAEMFPVRADTAETVAAEAGRPIPEPDGDDGNTVTHG